MINKTYKVRNEEVQEIMSKAPNVFVARGNVLVLISLFVVFYFLNDISLYQKENVHVSISDISREKSPDASLRLALSLNVNIPNTIHKNQSGRLFIQNLTFGSHGFLTGKIDSIGYNIYKVPIIYFEFVKRSLKIKEGMIGNLEIIVGKQTFLSMLLKRFF